MRNDDDLDQLLDRALEGFCGVEPRAGIAARVIANVRAVERRRRRWATWVAAVAAVLVLVVLVLPRKPVAVRPTVVASLPEAVQPELRVPPARVIRLRKSAPRVKRSITRAVAFPSPSPLTQEERALVQLATLHGNETALLTASREIKPLEIPELQISPLPGDGE